MGKIITFFTLIFFIVGLFLFYPEIKAEVDLIMLDNNSFKFQITTVIKKVREIPPVNNQFGIVISKINANAKIISFNSRGDINPPQYLLSQGVARIDESAYPGKIGNVILISQTPAELYETTRANPNFYLMYKLVPGDKIHLFYESEEYIYLVTDNKMTDNADLGDLLKPVDTKILTILSGWPPGTVMKRLIITAEMTDS